MARSEKGRDAGPPERRDGDREDGRGRQTVERRIRLSAETDVRLGVAAEIRRMTPSELIEWALVPHLAFRLPELPDVTMFPAHMVPTASPPRPRKGREGDAA